MFHDMFHDVMLCTIFNEDSFTSITFSIRVLSIIDLAAGYHKIIFAGGMSLRYKEDVDPAVDVEYL